MSKSKNVISLIGYLGNDPEIKTFPSGKKIANFTVVTSDGYKDASGEWKDKPNFHNVKAFGKLVDVVEKYVKKGNQISIEGSMDYNKHEDKQGVMKYYTAVLCRDLILLGGAKTQSNAPATAARPAAGSPPPPPPPVEEDENLPF